jgi:hypothetical protein
MQEGTEMRTREKARIWRRFMGGASVAGLSFDLSMKTYGQFAITGDEDADATRQIESILREGLSGKFDKGAR